MLVTVTIKHLTLPFILFTLQTFLSRLISCFLPFLSIILSPSPAKFKCLGEFLRPDLLKRLGLAFNYKKTGENAVDSGAEQTREEYEAEVQAKIADLEEQERRDEQAQREAEGEVEKDTEDVASDSTEDQVDQKKQS